MKIMIEIPKEFICDYEADRFEDCFQRFICDSKAGLMAGNYERETAEMLIKAFRDAEEVIRCKDCKHFSATTLGMPYACWRGGERVWGETGEHAWHTLCIRVNSPDWFCADGERREE